MKKMKNIKNTQVRLELACYSSDDEALSQLPERIQAVMDFYFVLDGSKIRRFLLDNERYQEAYACRC